MTTKFHTCAYCHEEVGNLRITASEPTVGDAIFCGRCGETSIMVGKTSTRKQTFEETEDMLKRPEYHAVRSAFLDAERGDRMLGNTVRIKHTYEAIASGAPKTIDKALLDITQSAYAMGLHHAFQALIAIHNDDMLSDEEAANAVAFLDTIIEDLMTMSYGAVRDQVTKHARKP